MPQYSYNTAKVGVKYQSINHTQCKTCHDIAIILLKLVLNTNQSIIHSVKWHYIKMTWIDKTFITLFLKYNG